MAASLQTSRGVALSQSSERRISGARKGSIEAEPETETFLAQVPAAALADDSGLPVEPAHAAVAGSYLEMGRSSCRGGGGWMEGIGERDGKINP